MYDAMNTNNSRAQKYLSIMALGFAGGSIYLIPFIRYVFYTWQADAMMITNQQLGILSTMYAIGNTLLYIPGGIVSDKFSTKKCLLFSLMSTTVLTFMFAMRVNSYSLALVIWLLFAFTTTFLFWCALMKTIRMLGSESEQGFLFGLYYMGNGLSGALINTIALKFTSEGASAVSNFKVGVYVYGASTLVAFILIFFFVKDTRGSEEAEDEKFIFNVTGLNNLFERFLVIFKAAMVAGHLVATPAKGQAGSDIVNHVPDFLFGKFDDSAGIGAEAAHLGDQINAGLPQTVQLIVVFPGGRNLFHRIVFDLVAFGDFFQLGPEDLFVEIVDKGDGAGFGTLPEIEHSSAGAN